MAKLKIMAARNALSNNQSIISAEEYADWLIRFIFYLSIILNKFFLLKWTFRKTQLNSLYLYKRQNIVNRY